MGWLSQAEETNILGAVHMWTATRKCGPFELQRSLSGRLGPLNPLRVLRHESQRIVFRAGKDAHFVLGRSSSSKEAKRMWDELVVFMAPTLEQSVLSRGIPVSQLDRRADGNADGERDDADGDADHDNGSTRARAFSSSSSSNNNNNNNNNNNPFGLAPGLLSADDDGEGAAVPGWVDADQWCDPGAVLAVRALFEARADPQARYRDFAVVTQNELRFGPASARRYAPLREGDRALVVAKREPGDKSQQHHQTGSQLPAGYEDPRRGFSSVSGAVAFESLDQVALPEAFEGDWAGNWKLQPGPGAGEEGWEYASSWHGPFRPRPGPADTVRRRRWIRVRVRKGAGEALASPTSPSSSSSSSHMAAASSSGDVGVAPAAFSAAVAAATTTMAATATEASAGGGGGGGIGGRRSTNPFDDHGAQASELPPRRPSQTRSSSPPRRRRRSTAGSGGGGNTGVGTKSAEIAEKFRSVLSNLAKEYCDAELSDIRAPLDASLADEEWTAESSGGAGVFNGALVAQGLLRASVQRASAVVQSADFALLWGRIYYPETLRVVRHLASRSPRRRPPPPIMPDGAWRDRLGPKELETLLLVLNTSHTMSTWGYRVVSQTREALPASARDVVTLSPPSAAGGSGDAVAADALLSNIFTESAQHAAHHALSCCEGHLGAIVRLPWETWNPNVIAATGGAGGTHVAPSGWVNDALTAVSEVISAMAGHLDAECALEITTCAGRSLGRVVELKIQERIDTGGIVGRGGAVQLSADLTALESGVAELCAPRDADTSRLAKCAAVFECVAAGPDAAGRMAMGMFPKHEARRRAETIVRVAGWSDAVSRKIMSLFGPDTASSSAAAAGHGHAGDQGKKSRRFKFF